MNKAKIKFSIVLGILFLLPVSKMMSQDLLTKETVGLKAGIFQRKEVSYLKSGDSGPNCLWDFSNIKISQSAFNVIQETDSLDRTTITDDSQVTYYIVKGDSLLEIGKRTPLKEITYYKPICNMKYPMGLNDSISTTFEGYGTYCGDHFFKQKGISSAIVDGSGDIILSENDTLKNVLRVYKVKSYSIAMDMDSSKIDSANFKQVIEEKYEWYQKGYNKPIFELVTSTSYANLKPLGTTKYAYYNIIDTQIDSFEDSTSEDEKQNESKEQPDKDIIHYDIHVTNNHINLDYSLDERANITMILANHMGMVYIQKKYTQEAGTNYKTNFDISSLRPGVYILYINVNGKIYNEKIRK